MKRKFLTYTLLIINLLCIATNIFYTIKTNFNWQKIICPCLLIVFLLNLFILVRNKDFILKPIFNISLIFLIIYNILVLNSTTEFLNISYLRTVPNFSNQSYTEVIKWASKNKIIVNEEYEYSDTTKEYYVISQDIKAGESLSNIKEINIVLSSGMNPDKELTIYDMSGENIDKVLDFIEQNGLSNVKIEYEDNDEIDEDKLVKQSIIGNIKRSDEIVFTFSRGDLNLEDSLTLINFKNMSKLRALAYLVKYDLNYEFIYDYSNSIKRDFVMKQNISKNSKIESNEKIILTISKGKRIVVPNLSNMSLSDISKWAIKNKIKLEINKKYDDTVPNDKIIESSSKKGDSLSEGDKIILTVSKGKLSMLDFSDLDKFKKWATKFDIRYIIDYEFNEDVISGNIIKFSHKKGETIKNGDTITVTVSNGNMSKVPNFIGMKKKDIEAKCKTAKLNCNYQYQNSNKDKDIAIRQSLSAGNEVAANSSISIILSNGKSTEASSKNNTSTEKNTTNNNTNNNTTTNNTQSNSNTQDKAKENTNQSSSETSTCTVKTVKVGRDLNNIISNPSNFQEVSSGLKEYFNNLNVSVNIVGDSTSGKASGVVVSGVDLGQEYTTCCPNNCKTYTIVLGK